MQKTILSLAIGLIFLLGMSACQPKSVVYDIQFDQLEDGEINH